MKRGFPFLVVLTGAIAAGCTSLPSREECGLRLAQPIRESHVPAPAAASAYKRANEYMERKDYRAALREFSAAIEADASFHVAYVGRGSARLAMLEYGEAIADYDRAIGAAPTLPDGWFAKGTAYWMTGQLTLAESALRRAVALSPEDGFYYQRLARVLYDEERVSDAQRLYQAAYEADTCREWALSGWLASLQDDQEQLGEALARLRSTDNAIVQYYSGWLAMQSGSYRRAADELSSALKDGGGQIPLSAYWDLAVASRELGDVEGYKKNAHEYYDRTGADVAGVQSQDLPKEFMRAVRDIILDGEEISSVAFAPNGGWLAIFGRNGNWRSDIPEALLERLRLLNREKRNVETVAIRPDGGWVVVYDRNGFAHAGVEANMVEKLRELNSAGKHIQLVAFAANNGWLVVYDDYGYWYWQLPDEVKTRLEQVNRERHRITAVGMARDNWSVTWGYNGYQAYAPKAMRDALQDFHDAKQSIDVVAFAPNGGWLVYSRSAAKALSPDRSHEGH